MRDILTWVQFINTTTSCSSPLSSRQSFLHGAHLVFLDALGSAAGVGGADMKMVADRELRDILRASGLGCEEEDGSDVQDFSSDGEKCGISPFMIAKGM